jgi:hypothetical protein
MLILLHHRQLMGLNPSYQWQLSIDEGANFNDIGVLLSNNILQMVSNGICHDLHHLPLVQPHKLFTQTA